jgi:hypothetical protein
MAQAQQAIADTIAAERKRREQREQEKAAKTEGNDSDNKADSETPA